MVTHFFSPHCRVLHCNHEPGQYGICNMQYAECRMQNAEYKISLPHAINVLSSIFLLSFILCSILFYSTLLFLFLLSLILKSYNTYTYRLSLRLLHSLTPSLFLSSWLGSCLMNHKITDNTFEIKDPYLVSHRGFYKSNS